MPAGPKPESKSQRPPPMPCRYKAFRSRKCQPACKPGSVWPRRLAAPERGGHSSWARIAARLVQPTRAAGRKLPRGFPLMPPLFGLAPGVVYRAIPVTGNAVGTYPTLSPLPGRRRPGGLLSVALSLGSPPPDVIRHRVSREPGLSSHAAFRLRMRGRPAGWRCALRYSQAKTQPRLAG